MDKVELTDTEKAQLYYGVRNKANEAAKPKRFSKRIAALATSALALVLVFTVIFNSMPISAAIAEVEYPSADDIAVDEAIDTEYLKYLDSLKDFAYGSIASVDRGADGNTVYSPYSISILMSTLAELSSGETKKEILSFFNAKSAEQLSEFVHDLYLSVYSDTDEFICRSVQSIWLDNSVKYKADCQKHGISRPRRQEKIERQRYRQKEKNKFE